MERAADPGETLAVGLLFILSQGDHCLSHVEPWVAQHHGTLSALLGKTVLPVHFHDDRLADWLDRLCGSDSFSALERDLNQQTVRVIVIPWGGAVSGAAWPTAAAGAGG